jgi:hypothetical protein
MTAKIRHFFKENWLVVLILLVAAFLRLYRLKELTTFAGDQGIDLLAVKRILDGHWTLLGPKTSILSVYNGPIYYYLLLPVLYFFKLEAVSPSYFMVCLWLGAIFLTYLLTKKMFNRRAATLAALLFSVWPIAIEYSRSSFNSFPTPFFAAFFIWSAWRFFRRKSYWAIALAGGCAGVMMQLHYFNFFLIALSVLFLVLKRKLTIKSLLIFLTFGALTFSPMIAFELRHQFFNTKTLIFSLRGGGVKSFSFQIHYFISFFPLIFVGLGYVLERIIKWNRILGTILLAAIIILNVKGLDLRRNHGYTMPENWSLVEVEKASEIISGDAKSDFNVAAILDGDTRAYPYRYIIETTGKRPMGVEEYPKAETLYVIGKGEAKDILSYPVWEISSFLPAKVTRVWPIKNSISVFKLERVKGER